MMMQIYKFTIYAERERERERSKQTDRDRYRDKETVTETERQMSFEDLATSILLLFRFK